MSQEQSNSLQKGKSWIVTVKNNFLNYINSTKSYVCVDVNII